MRVQLDAARLLTYRAALRSEAPGVRFSKESSMAKVFATEACNAIAAPGGARSSADTAIRRSIPSSGTIGTRA